MRPVSAAFLSTLRGSHGACFRARVCTSFQTGNDPDGVEIPILDGNVQAASTANIRATLNLTTGRDPQGAVPAAEWPRNASGLLAPYGNEIFVESGVAYGNGSHEWVSHGYFRINNPEQDDAPTGPIDITATDRMAGIIDGRFLTPRQFASTMTFGQLVAQLVTEVYPLATISWDDTGVRDTTVGRTVTADRDRYQTLMDLVTSLGKVGYWRYDGVFRVETPPAISGTPSWEVNSGRNGVLTKLSRSITREGIYNVVVASGEATDTTPPVWGAVADLSPSSPTRYGGPFGPVPRFYTSPFLTTNDQCRLAAEVLLRKSLGLPYSVNCEAVPNPALEPDDLIRIGTERHIIDVVTIPLHPRSPITITTRKQYGEQTGDVTE
ncbi:DUF5047 domain-containing protein [Kribbella solani]|uniref:DUF5047 domain-containing protein n=1 Tax=Kribbella solani TaxID=236067 RepID=A0A841E056_9ACTN|nr:DUF5047 domain-containing protein [Kribbella solani]MBB5982416.1 hypothetical protein [Kribbella solani]